MKTGLSRTPRKIETTRLENWALPGVPDVLLCNESGQFSFLELKIATRNKANLSPHQVAWMGRHAHSNCYIVTRNTDLVIDVYSGGSAVDLCMDGLAAVSALGSFEEPYNWEEFWRLTCGEG